MDYSKHYKPKFLDKIIEQDNLIDILSNNNKGKIVFTNGCFDILHCGHVMYLSQAKALGDTLIVALNSDESIKLLGKGDNRPINNLESRLMIIAALDSVDYVTFFHESNPLNLILKIKPSVLAKGGDWDIEDIIGYKEILEAGGSVHSIPFIFDISTTKIIEKIQGK